MPGGDDEEPIHDARAEFERLTRATPRDPAAERAFLIQRMELLRSLANVSDAERDAGLAELQRLLDELDRR